MAERICVTGGTGFLGRHLVPDLIRQGHGVCLLVRNDSCVPWEQEASFPTGALDVVRGDVTDPEPVARAMAGCRFVVHAAGHFRFWGTEEVFQRVNVGGTTNVARAALSAGVERMVHISTIVVVGDHPPDEVIEEDTPCTPIDPYQRSKYAAEQSLLNRPEFARLPVVILRPNAFYGPYGRYGFNRLFIEDPMRGLRFQIEGGRLLTFPVYVPDVAGAVSRALRYGRVGEVYNVGDESVPHAQVNRLVSEVAGWDPTYRDVPRQPLVALAALLEVVARITRREPFYPLNLRHYVFQDWRVSSEKARQDLGFTPTPLAEGLRRTVAWYKRQDGGRSS